MEVSKMEGACRGSTTASNVDAMKSRLLFLAAAVIFLVIAGMQLRAPRNLTAAALNAGAGAIFLFLGAVPPKRTRP
jgi:hypothetical protein